MGIATLEVRVGWEIKCVACGHHTIWTKKKGKHNWSFNGDVERPTFSPSINETCNDPSLPGYNPEAQSSRCHFTVTDGVIQYHNDCSHNLAGQRMTLIPFTVAEVACHSKDY